MNPKERQSCASDAGVSLVSKCISGQWAYQYPECRTECNPDGGGGASSSSSSTGGGGGGGGGGNPCRDRVVAAGSGWYWRADCGRSCSGNSDCPQNPQDPNPATSNWCYLFDQGMRCMQRIQEGGGGGGGGGSSSSSGGGGGGGGGGGTCFQLSGETYADSTGGGFRFNTHVKVFSPPGGGDGHIQLWVDGASKGWNQPWNKGANNPFDIEPQYLDSPTLSSGQSATKSYRVKIDECGDRGNTAEISCTYSVNGSSPNVTGSCSCASGNCSAGPPPVSSSSSAGGGPPPVSSSSRSSTSSRSSSSAPNQNACQRAGHNCEERYPPSMNPQAFCINAGYTNYYASLACQAGYVCCGGDGAGQSSNSSRSSSSRPASSSSAPSGFNNCPTMSKPEGKDCVERPSSVCDSYSNGYYLRQNCASGQPSKWCCKLAAGSSSSNPAGSSSSNPPANSSSSNPPAGSSSSAPLGPIDYDRVGSIIVKLSLNNIGSRNINTEKNNFNIVIDGNPTYPQVQGNQLVSNWQNIQRYTPAPHQAIPHVVSVWFQGNVDAGQNFIQIINDANITFRGDEFEKTIEASFDYDRITKRFTLKINNNRSNCTTIAVGGNSIFKLNNTHISQVPGDNLSLPYGGNGFERTYTFENWEEALSSLSYRDWICNRSDGYGQEVLPNATVPISGSTFIIDIR